MADTLPFGEVLEVVDQLSLKKKEVLIEVLNRRIIEARQGGIGFEELRHRIQALNLPEGGPQAVEIIREERDAR